MVKLRKLAHRAIDAVSDRVDHLATALENNVRSPVVPERIRALGSGSEELVGDLTVVQGFDDGGTINPDFSHTGIPLLDSFYFQFTNDDHHLGLIAIIPDRTPGEMFLAFQDQNGDDDYFFKVIHRVVNDSRVQQFSRPTDICSEEACTVELSRPVGDFVFVLIGFSFGFTGARDNHIRSVEINERRGSLTVRFRDKNTSPPPIFLWDVQYAYVPRDLFVELGRSDGRGDRGGAGRDISAGPSVIRGFRFNFVDDDHHLRDIGITTPDNGRVEVFFEDHNSDDAFNWSVDWGILTA